MRDQRLGIARQQIGALRRQCNGARQRRRRLVETADPQRRAPQQRPALQIVGLALQARFKLVEQTGGALRCLGCRVALGERLRRQFGPAGDEVPDEGGERQDDREAERAVAQAAAGLRRLLALLRQRQHAAFDFDARRCGLLRVERAARFFALDLRQLVAIDREIVLRPLRSLRT